MENKSIKKISTLIVFILLAFGIYAQQYTLKSKITDTSSGDALIGATVKIKGGSQGTITDLDGTFNISVNGDVILQISYTGYITREVRAEKGIIPSQITLEENKQELKEIIVIGFGTQKKVNLTGSVGVVDSKTIESRPITNAAQALQGLVGGLNVTNESGSLSSSPAINIRGITTIGQGSNGNPLILVDGVETDLSTVNPQDIESVSVLKDVASSSIYGARAPFGVVLITTKKAKRGKMQLSYNNNFRFSSAISHPSMADSYWFVNTMNSASGNAGWGNFFNPDMVKRVKQYMDGEITTTTIPEPNNPRIWDTGYFNGNDNINYYDILYRKDVPSQEYNLSLSGGNEKYTYYISGNYLYQSGLLNYGSDNAQRYTTTGKFNAKVNDMLDVQYIVKFTRNNLSQPSHMLGMFYEDLARQIWPTKPLYDNNGILFDDHVLGLVNGGKDKQQNNSFQQGLQAVFEPIEGWRFVGDLNYRMNSFLRHQDYLTYYQTAVDGVNIGNMWYQSSVSEQMYNNNYYNISLYTDYEKTLNDSHHFKIMGGAQVEGNDFRDVYANRNGILDRLVPTINTTTGMGRDLKAVAPSVSGGYSDWAVVGFFGRLNYNFKERYLFEANVRYDGSSRFRAGNRWGLFPSFSAGWNITNEEFFSSLSHTVNLLKLRASYGSLGNQNTNLLYPTYEIMGLNRASGQWLIDGKKTTYAWMPALIDESLTWEKINSWNAGIDLSLLNNRLSTSFDYYVRFTNNMVGPAPEMPATLGIAVAPSNNTDLQTWGFEFELSWRDKLPFGLGYGARFVLSDSQTKITRYPNPTNVLTKFREGQMWGEIWGYTTKGIAKTDDEMFDHISTLSNGGQDQMGSNWKAGDIMYVDVDDNGRIDWGDNTSNNPGDVGVIGNSTPRFSYGVDLTADFKGFDMRIFLQGIMKRDFFQNSYYFWGMNGGQGPWFSTLFEEHKDYFRANENDPFGQNLDSYYPRPLFGTAKNQQVQTRYLQNAAYLRLKNVQIGYTLPQTLTQKVKIQKARLYFSGENLLTFTKLSTIFDPETIGGGWGGSVYPLSKTYSFGLSVVL